MKKILVMISLLVINVIFAYQVIGEEQAIILQGIIKDKDRYNAEKADINYKVYYDVDEKNKTVKRLYLENMKNNETINDSTEYAIIENYINPLDNKKYIKAVGKPANPSLELLVIGEKNILSSRSTLGYIVLTEMKRIK